MSWRLVILAKMLVDRVQRATIQEAVAVCGMAVSWAVLLGGPSYPAFLMMSGDPFADQTATVVFDALLVVACALIAALALRERRPRVPDTGPLAGFGLLACLGTALVAATRFGPAFPAAPSFVGLALLALGAALSFIGWARTLDQVRPDRAASGAALSFALFCLADIAWNALVPATFATALAAPVGLVVLAFLESRLQTSETLRDTGQDTLAEKADASPALGETIARRPGRSPGMRLTGALAALCVAAVCAAELGNVLFGFGTAANGDGAAVDLSARRLAVRGICLAVFLPLGLALRRPGATRSLTCAFGVLATLFVGELLASALLYQAAPAIADLPSVAAALAFQALAWPALLLATEGRPRGRALAPVAFLAGGVALPKLLAAVAALDVDALGFVPGSVLPYLVSAGSAFALVAVAGGCVVAALLRWRSQPVAPPNIDVPFRAGQAISTSTTAPLCESGTGTRFDLLGNPVPTEVAVQGSPTTDALHAPTPLSRREHEVFSLLSRGYTARRIAQELYISESTVQTHVKRIYAKCGVHSKQELIELVHSGRQDRD